MNILEMKNGQWARISRLVGDSWLCLRLMELGFTEGEYLRRFAASPFNNPVVVNIRGSSYALRSQEAMCIEVEPVDPAPAAQGQ